VRPLDPLRYAQTHAIFEAASDQRARIRQWLVETLPPRFAEIVDRPLRILGVGVGDGSIDAPLAAALAADGRLVHYEGVEPHDASAARFIARLEALDRPGLCAAASVCTFADFEGTGDRDLVHFVHSLYYVDELGAALDHALRLLRPGGLLVALMSPRPPLSEVAAALAERGGFPQWYAEALEAQLTSRELSATRVTIDATLDIGPMYAEPRGIGELLFDFLAQVRTRELSAATRDAILDYLREIADSEHPTRLPHPVTAVILRAPEREGHAGDGRT
jgi:SAM-dependent methyltransferase